MPGVRDGDIERQVVRRALNSCGRHPSVVHPRVRVSSGGRGLLRCCKDRPVRSSTAACAATMRRQRDLRHGCLFSSCRWATTAAISASLSVIRLMTATPASAARTRISSAPRMSGALNCAPPFALTPWQAAHPMPPAVFSKIVRPSASGLPPPPLRRRVWAPAPPAARRDPLPHDRPHRGLGAAHVGQKLALPVRRVADEAARVGVAAVRRRDVGDDLVRLEVHARSSPTRSYCLSRARSPSDRGG